MWDCLYWQEDAAPQTVKNREERQQLSSQALGFFRHSRNSPYSRSSEEEPDLPLILVDDVTTTGTTLKVAAEVLEKEGYTVSRGLVCCYAPPGGVVL